LNVPGLTVEQRPDSSQAAFNMTSRPVYPPAPRTYPELIVGFPDIIGNFPVQTRFGCRFDCRIAANASGKRPDRFGGNSDSTDQFKKLFPIMIGADDYMRISGSILPAWKSPHQKDSFRLKTIEKALRQIRFIESVKSKHTQPFGKPSQWFCNCKTKIRHIAPY